MARAFGGDGRVVIRHLQEQHFTAHQRWRLAQLLAKVGNLQRRAIGAAQQLIHKLRNNSVQHNVNVIAQRDGLQRRRLIFQSLMPRDAANHGVEIVMTQHQHAVVRLLLVVGAVCRLHLQAQRGLSRAALAKHNRGRWMRWLAKYLSKVWMAAQIAGLRQHRILRGLLGRERVGLKSMPA